MLMLERIFQINTLIILSYPQIHTIIKSLVTQDNSALTPCSPLLELQQARVWDDEIWGKRGFTLDGRIEWA